MRLVRHTQLFNWSWNGSFSLNKLTDSCNSPCDWLMTLAMDLFSCFVWYVEMKITRWTPFGCFQCWHTLCQPHHGSPRSTTLHPYRSAYGINCSSSYLKWQAIQPTIYFNSLHIDRLGIAIESYKFHVSICFPSWDAILQIIKISISIYL